MNSSNLEEKKLKRVTIAEESLVLSSEVLKELPRRRISNLGEFNNETKKLKSCLKKTEPIFDDIECYDTKTNNSSNKHEESLVNVKSGFNIDKNNNQQVFILLFYY